MENYSVRDEIIEIANKLFVYTDAQNWRALQKEVFTPNVHFDMSSINGKNREMSAVEICEDWRKGFENIDAVNHLAGNYLVDIQNNSANVFAYATATHYKKDASKGTVREFVGTYNLHLIKTDEGWRIDAFQYNLKYAAGNINFE